MFTELEERKKKKRSDAEHLGTLDNYQNLDLSDGTVFFGVIPLKRTFPGRITNARAHFTGFSLPMSTHEQSFPTQD